MDGILALIIQEDNLLSKILNCLSLSKPMQNYLNGMFDIKGLADSRNWAGRIDELAGEESGDAWLERMLEASGMLVRLSDACSLVRNPFAPEERIVR